MKVEAQSSTGLSGAPRPVARPRSRAWTRRALAGLVVAAAAAGTGIALTALTPTGPELRINTTVSGNQSEPSAAVSAAGSSVVVWTSDGNLDGDGRGVFGQRYDAAGAAVGGEFPVNTYTPDDQRAADVAMDASGDFVVVWSSVGQDGDLTGVYAQRFDAAGVKQGAEFRVSQATSGHQNLPSVEMNATGAFVVTWKSNSGATKYDVIARRYSAAGAPLGNEFTVNTNLVDDQDLPTVALDAGGAFTVAWMTRATVDGSGRGVFARRYDASGAALGPDVQVNTTASRNQDRPSMAMTPTGESVIAWVSGNNQDGDRNGVYAQRYGATGAAQGGEFRVNTTTADSQDWPSVGIEETGRFTVGWASNNQDGGGKGVYAQTFDFTGSRLGSEQLVNVTTASDQRFPAVAVRSNGDAFVVWEGNGPGDSSGVFGRRYQLVNEAPVNAVPDAQTATGAAPLVFSAAAGNAISVSDTDGGGAVEQVTLTATQGTLTLPVAAGLTFLTGDGTADPTMTFQGTLAALNAALDGLQFTCTPWYSGPASVQITTDDLGNQGTGGPLSDTDAVAISVVQSGTPYVLTGSYVGDGVDGRAITAVGFRPDVVIVKGSDGNKEAVLRTVSMSGDVSKELTGATALLPNLVQSLTASGFTVGNSDRVNAAGVTYQWIAFKASASVLTVGSYVGTGAAGRTVTGLGFAPDALFVAGADNDEAVFRTSAAAEAYNFSNATGRTDWITSLDGDGFTLGNDPRVNGSGATYHYLAWNEVPGLSDVGGYVGDGADGRNLAGPGFRPGWLLVKSEEGDAAVHRPVSQGAGDDTLFFTANAQVANRIQALQPNGFQVGSDADVNATGRAYGYAAWRQETAPTISNLTDETTLEDTPTAAVPFTVGDAESGAGSLLVRASSSNQVLLPDSSIALGGSGAARTITLTPAANAYGTTTVTVTVSDGAAETTDTFVLTVTADNDAPLLDSSGTMTLTTITEDQATGSGDAVSSIVASAGGDRITDVDSALAFEGFAVTGTADGNGTWEYTVDGANWLAVGSVSNSSALLLRDTDRLRFVPDGQNGTSATVAFRAWDQTSGSAGTRVDASTSGGTTAFSTATGTAGITVAAVNDAPSLSVASGFASIVEDAATNAGTPASNFAGWATDVDAGALEGLAITAVDDSNGTWQYTLDGTSWLEIGSVSSSSARLLPSDAVTRIRFVPDPDWNGSTGLTSYKAWDQTTGTAGGLADVTVNGGSTAFSTGTSGTTLSVTAVNDAPTATAGSVSLAAVPEDTAGPTGATVSSLFGSVFSDTADDVAGGSSANAFAGVAIVVNAANAATQGVWQWFDGSVWGNVATSVSTSSALALAPTAPVRFLPAADYNGTPGALTVRLVDDSSGALTSGGTIAVGSGGGTSQVSSAADAVTLGTSISAVNDNPVAVDDTIAGANEGATFAFMSSILSNDSDVDGDTLTASLVSGPSRAVSFTLDPDGSFTYRHDGSETTSDSFVYRASDGNGGFADATVYLTIAPWNDPPATTIAQPTYAATEQTTLTLHGTGLSVADPDAGAASVQATLSATSGTLTASTGTTGATVAGSGTGSLTIGGTVTQIDDLLAGNLGGSLTYVDASDTPPASVTLTLQVDDLGNTGGGGARNGSDTALIIITAVNDAPVITSNGGGAAAAISVPESTMAVGTVTSTDVDGGVPLYSVLPGADGARFGIDASTGTLSFATAPDFENPADVGADNVYDVILQVDDGSGGTDTQSVAVTVTDLADGIRVTPVSVLPLAGETRVNTATGGNQTIMANVAQAVASDAAGNSVVVWASDAEGADVFDIYAQRFDSEGTAQGVEFRVNTTTADSQINPAVAMDAAGNFVVTWSSNLQDGSGYGVYAQRFDAAGVPVASEFLVNTTTSGSQIGSAVAAAAAGAFVVTWTAAGQDPDGSSGIYAQRYDASGAAQGGEFRVNSYTTETQQLSSVSTDEEGNFVVTWVSLDQDGSGYGVYGRRFAADGAAEGPEFRVNTTVVNSQLYHDVAMLPDGRFVVVFQSRSADGSFEVYLQRYATDGSTLGGETRVNTTTVSPAQQPIASIAADAAGNLMVVWNSAADGSGVGVVGRRLSWSGTPLGGELQVNTTSTGDQLYPEIAALPGGRFVVAWGGGGPGDANGVFSRRYGLTTTESGGTATFEVVLEAAPTADVTLPLSVPDGSEGTVSTGSLTFTSGNWSAAQTVTVTGVQDYANDGAAVYTVALGNATSGDANFDGLSPDDLSVTNLEVPNVAPVSTVPGAQSVGEDTALVFSSAGSNAISIDDADAGTNPVQVTLSVTDGLLTLAGVTGLSFSAGANGSASMTFTGTITDINAAVDGLRFDPTANFGGSAILALAVDDLGNTGMGGARSDDDTVEITVTAANDVPVVVAVPASVSVLEDGPAASVQIDGVDVETAAADLLVTVTQVPAKGTLRRGAVVLTVGSTFTGTPATVTYTPAADANGADQFGVKVTDTGDGAAAALDSAELVVPVAVAPVNDAPSFVAGGDVTVDEDAGAETVAGWATAISAGPADESGQTLAFQVSNDDNGLFSVQPSVSTAGVLSFTPAVDANGQALVSVFLRDDGGTADGGDDSSSIRTFTITVTPVNDQPVAVAGSGSVGEDAASLSVDLRGLVADRETADADLTFTVVSGPAVAAGVLTATGTNGVFSFAPAADFNGSASFTYQVTDRGDPDDCVAGPGCSAALASAVRTFTITVSAVNDVPSATDGADTVGEDAPSLSVDLRGLVADRETADADLTFTVVSGPAVAAGVLTATGTNGVFSFAPAADFNGSASFTYQVTDRGDPDDCGAPGPACDVARTSTVQTFTITVTAANDAPVITSNGGGDAAALTVLEGTTSVTDVNAIDADAGASLTYSIAGGADAAAFVIDSASGVLSFVAAPDFEAPGDADGDNLYDVSVGVSDGALSDTQDLTVTVTDVALENQAPTIGSSGGGDTASVSIVENTTSVVDVDATDPDPGNTVTYSLAGGADAGRFQIDGGTGMLSFASAPDFEAPADANGDNLYEVVVSASDGSLADTQTLSISVTDADETPANQPPAITSGGGAATPGLEVEERTTSVGIVEASDPEGILPAYAIRGGADALLFTLDPVSGALSFLEAPDYENPADSDLDNVYEVEVEASDGSLADVQALAVRVLDVNEGPTSLVPSGLVTDEDVALVLRSADGQVLTIDDPDGPGGTVRVTVSVTMGSLTLPSRSGLAFSAGDGTAGRSLTFTGSIADVNSALDGLTFTPTANAYGIVTLVLVSTDPAAADLSDTSRTTVVVRPVNDPPVLAAIGGFQGVAGTAVAFDASAGDVDGPELTYSLVGAPAGARIDPTTGAFTWTPTAAQAPGSYTFDVLVRDGGTPERNDRVTVTVTVTKPVASTPPPASAPGTDDTQQGGSGASEPTPATSPSLQARNDRARATSPASVVIAVVGNDVIPAGESVTVTAGPAGHGTVRVRPDGSVVYTPASGFEGTDRFRYTIVGTDGRSSSAVVEVVVEPSQQASSSWIGGPLFGAAAPNVMTEASEQIAATLHTGFLVMAQALLETLRGLDTPVRLLAVAGAWVGLFGAWLLVFRRRRAFLVEGVSRNGALDVLDRPEGECRYRLRFDDGPVWSIGRRRRLHGRTWVPVTTRAGSGYVELDRLLALDLAVDSPRAALQG